MNRSRSAWFGYGFLNILEHGLARGMDAVATFAILWCVPTEVFSQLAVAQACVAPALFFFVSPETVLYRDFGKWKSESPGITLARLRVFRRFAWAKALAAIVLSGIFAIGFPSPSGAEFGLVDRFASFVWAFFLPLLPQISGPDREYLRLDLDLKTLNFLTFFQRAIYLLLLVPAAKVFPSSFPVIAGCGVGTSLLTSWLARRKVEAKFAGVSPGMIPEGTSFAVIRNSLRGFSIWNHVSGVVIGWIQTMDLFFLAWFRVSALDVGIYGVVLKFANFTLALPYAVSNLFNVYLGRATVPDRRKEIGLLARFSLALAVFSAVQAFAAYLLAPYVIRAFSRGRWTSIEEARMLQWLKVILPATAVFASSLFWSGWMGIRTPFRKLVVAVYLPWGAVAIAIYASAARWGGAEAVARANLSVMLVFIALLAVFSVISEKPGRAARSSL